MKYIVKNKDYSYVADTELLELLLQQRGVANPQGLLNLDPSCIHDGMLFNNMKWGLELLAWHINNGSRIHIIIDSDVDGFTSAAFMFQYLTDLGVEATYSTHVGKEHGITEKAIAGFDFDLLIVPDAGTNDVEMSKYLADQGKDIIILDHHKFEGEYNTHACVINCHDGHYPNNTLSGVGVVYKFCREFDKMYGFDFANYYLDLVAVGLVADSMDLRNFETRFLALEGIKLIGQCNEFLKEIAIEQEFSLGDEITLHGISWYIAPLINGAIRGGSQEEKIRVWEALAGFRAEVEYKPRKSAKNPNPQIEIQTLQKAMVRVCKSIKGKQDREIKKSVATMLDHIEAEGLAEEKIIMMDVTDVLAQSHTGLVANKLASQFKRPVILLRDKKNDDSSYGGSGRNYSRFAVDNLRLFLLETGQFESVSGHDSAFGFSLPKANVETLRTQVNEQLKDVVIEDVYHVDYEIAVGRLKEKHVKQVGQWKNMWANTLPEPTFAITDVYISSEEIKLLGEKKNIIRFDIVRGDEKIAFIKRFASESLYNEIIHRSAHGLSSGNKRLKLTVIGKFSINKFNGNEYPQVEIVDVLSEVQARKVMF
jgi:single-stranded-DNA-specific exonuclease